jgi:hypothetical protein
MFTVASLIPVLLVLLVLIVWNHEASLYFVLLLLLALLLWNHDTALCLVCCLICYCLSCLMTKGKTHRTNSIVDYFKSNVMGLSPYTLDIGEIVSMDLVITSDQARAIILHEQTQSLR